MRHSPLALLAALLLALPVSGRAEEGTSLDLMHVDLMYVGAHPDDDGAVMATFARYHDQGYRTMVVTVTGGEGGANAIGPEAGAALGLIRREEERRVLAAVGVEMTHFLGLADFHFTLSAEEAAAHWGEGFVCDVVRDVRLHRPEVLITMWPGPGTHGQHQMAARAATLAFDRAGDPAYCPEQIKEEFLTPFAPAKLYYIGPPAGAEDVLAVPTTDVSPRTGERYADVRARALIGYRSQGLDRVVSVPAKEAWPERFLLARSRVPRSSPETSLLEGARLPAGDSPAGVRLEVEPASYRVAGPTEVRVRLVNGTAHPLSAVAVRLTAPPAWTLSHTEPLRREALAPGEEIAATFTATPAATADPSTDAVLEASYEAQSDGRAVGGANRARVRATPAVEVSFKPLFDVAGYREFAARSHTEWVIPTLPTRVPLLIGRATPVEVVVENHRETAAAGQVELKGPAGVALEAPAPFSVPAHGKATVRLSVRAGAEALPEGRHSAKVPLSVGAADGPAGRDQAEAYLLPVLDIPRLAHSPVIDGELADLSALAPAQLGPADLWWRQPPSGPADLSADVRLGWDARALYVGVRVHDDAVVCNIAPGDLRGVLRTDAVALTVDPSGASHDTSTTLQLGAFPCTTAGFAPGAFREADARPGPAAETLPGLQVASRRLEDGYALEAAIPWAAMPVVPKPGAEIGLNVVVYDADDLAARPGANVTESGIAWAAFQFGGKQALPYLWPRVRLRP